MVALLISKLAIADAGDSILDSAVFVQGTTFSDAETPIEGGLPGTNPENPLLPEPNDNTEDGFDFEFGVFNPDELIFIDPEVAIGYDYIVNSGPNITSVELPTGIGDDLYDLFLFDAGLNDFVDSGLDLTGGVSFDFAAGGVDRFRILGIEISEALDPNDPTAFTTGLTFASTGIVQMSQIPITQNTEPVPEPMTILGTLTAGAFGTQFMRKRKQMKAAKSKA